MTETGELAVITQTVLKTDADKFYGKCRERNLDPNDFLTLMIRSFCRGPQIFALDEKLWFGKYANVELETVIRGDPAYIRWLLQHSTWFEIDAEAMELLDSLYPKKG